MKLILAALLTLAFFAPGAAEAFYAFKRDPNLDWAAEHRLGADVRNLMWELQVDNAARCGEEVVGQTGIQLALGKPRWDSLEAFYEGQGWSYGNTIIQIAAGSPAEDAGLRVGDVVTRVDGKRIKLRKDDEDAIENQERLQNAEKRRESFVVEFERNGESQSATLVPVKVCDVRPRPLHVHYVTDQRFKPNEALLPPEYVAQLSDTASLRVLVAHEFAHHAAGHYRRRNALGFAGVVADTVTAGATTGLIAGAINLAKADEDELEADRLAFEILQAQGIELDTILSVWGRVEQLTAGRRFDNPLAHPVTPERLSRLRALSADTTASTIAP